MSDFIIKNGVLKEYTGPGGDVVIPKGVKKIGRYAFGSAKNLKSVVIPDGVTEIGECAFEDQCLVSVLIPESV